MGAQEPIEYEVALESAERNQRKALALIPAKLQAREDRFFEQMRRAKIGPAKKLAMLYSLMEELSEAISPLTPCKNGCSLCCHYNVSVSEIEVAYIEKHTKHRRLKALGEKRDYHGEACPFLLDGSCSIYESRPFVCRRHSALTPNAYWCHHDRSSRYFPLVGFTRVNQVFEGIRLETNACEPSDIRQVFGAAANAQKINSPGD